MLQLPAGYLTVDKPRRRPINLWDYFDGREADIIQLAILLGLVAPAILFQIVRNVFFLHH